MFTVPAALRATLKRLPLSGFTMIRGPRDPDEEADDVNDPMEEHWTVEGCITADGVDYVVLRAEGFTYPGSDRSDLRQCLQDDEAFACLQRRPGSSSVYDSVYEDDDKREAFDDMVAGIKGIVDLGQLEDHHHIETVRFAPGFASEQDLARLVGFVLEECDCLGVAPTGFLTVGRDLVPGKVFDLSDGHARMDAPEILGGYFRGFGEIALFAGLGSDEESQFRTMLEAGSAAALERRPLR